MELKTTIAGLDLEHPVMNAAGTCKTVEDADKVLQTASAAVVIGSITMDPRPGNTGNVYVPTERTGGIYSLNSLGLPNPGREYWQRELPDFVRKAHDLGKPVIVSVAGSTPDEYAILAESMLKADADAVELNFGCPNLWEAASQKLIPSFHAVFASDILEKVSWEVGTEARIGVKLSPFSNPAQLRETAAMLKIAGFVQFLTTSNTFPNAFAWGEDGQPSITPGGGLAGMAGPAMRAVGLGQVRQFRALLTQLSIIGVGGIWTGQDVLDYLRSGSDRYGLPRAGSPCFHIHPP